MPQVIAGTFTTGSVAAPGEISDTLVILEGRTSFRLTLTGLDASNTVKTQKRTSPGGTWVDQVTYNANQNAVSVPAAQREEWRLWQVTQQPVRDVKYVLDGT